MGAVVLERDAHGLVWLTRTPTAVERDSLHKLGVDILSPLPHGVYWAAIARNADTARMPLRPGFYAAVESRYRVGPEIWNQDVKRYLTKDRDGRIRNYVLNADSTLNAVAHFHDDVSRSEAERILRAHGLSQSLVSR